MRETFAGVMVYVSIHILNILTKKPSKSNPRVVYAG